MAKGLNQVHVGIQFDANTNQAKAAIRDLQQELQILSQSTSLNINTTSIQGAKSSILELKNHLQQATNVDTGRLDFSKFNASLKKSGKTLASYGETLLSLGSEGEKAFTHLIDSVSKSEVPLRKTNTLIKEMGTTLANTARWQISSSILHGFMGAVQKAYGYAEDLNESLNNIRIVTGQDIDQMSKFAQQANKAAKALSTTTTDYTDASLIYYQQGLSDAQVKERTDITIKMANVARESAEIVSDQMTAVWNNFDDGSKSLEYYADVMTALGAATASSTDEIAQGLEKFSAVAGTVGLSYEYATSALATVTAETRQSADVVGTAFKTLFARIEGLSLGETLEDGTDLNKYSEALSKVGVQIKDLTTGEMKSMDQILSELGSRWQTLAQDEKIALAQTVAGVRQYNQLISLMDNWDVFQENLGIARGSSGALDEQAKIYAESWEAAQKRVTAAAESIYQSLINDEFFIDLLNIFEKLINGVGSFISGLGGASGVLTLLGSIATKVFKVQIAQGINDAIYSLKAMSKEGQKALLLEKQNTVNQAAQSMANHYMKEMGTSKAPQDQQQMVEMFKQRITLSQTLVENAEKMGEIELQTAQALLDNYNERISKQIELNKRKNENNEELVDLKVQARGEYLINGTNKKGYQDTFNRFLDTTKRMQDITGSHDIGVDSTADIKKAGEFRKLGQEQRELMSSLQEEYGLTEETLKKIIENLKQGKNIGEEIEQNGEELNNEAQEFVNYVNQAAKDSRGWGDVFGEATRGLMSFGTALSSLTGLYETFTNPDTSGWEKFLAILTSVSMISYGLVDGFKAFKEIGTIMNAIGARINENTGELIANTVATKANEISKKEQSKSLDKNGQEFDENSTDINENTVANSVDTAGEVVEDVVENTDDLADGLEKVSKKGDKVSGKFTNMGKAGKTGFKNIGTSLKSLGSTLVKFLPALIGIAAAAAIIYGVSEYYNKDANAAKDAAENASMLSEEYSKAKDAYENLKASISEYQSATDALSELKKGTIEYEEALLKANDAAMKLIETHKDLEYTINPETGAIEIDKNSIQKVQAEELINQSMAQRASVNASANASDKKIQSDITDFNREYAKHFGVSDEDLAIIGGSVGAGAAAGAGIGTTLGLLGGPFAEISVPAGLGFGALIGAGVGLASGLTATGLTGDSEEQEEAAIADLASAYASGTKTWKELKQTLEDSGKYTNSLINSLDENSAKTMELIKSIDANTQQQKLYETQQMTSYLQNSLDAESKLIYDQSKFKDQLAYMMVNSDEYKTAHDTATTATDKMWDKDVHQAYADLMGWETEKIKNKWGKAEFVFNDETKKTLTDEEMRDFLSKEYARQEAAKQIETFNTTLSDLDAYGQALGKAAGISKELSEEMGEYVGSFSANNTHAFETATQEQIDALKEARASGHDFGITDEEAKNLGYTNAESYLNALDKALEAYDPEVALAKRAKKEQEELNKLYEQGSEKAGVSSKALENYAEYLEKNTKGLNDNKKAAAACAIQNATFAKGVEELGKVLDENAEQLNNLSDVSIDTFESVAKVQTALEKVFGVEVSYNYVVDNLEKIRKLANGDTTALEELRIEAAKDYVVGLGIDDSGVQVFNDLIDNLMAQDHTIGIGAEVDMGDSIDQINELMQAGVLTADEVTKAFNAIGYEPEIDWITAENPNPTTHTSDVSVSLGGKDVSIAKVTTTTDDVISMPYIKSSTTTGSGGVSGNTSGASGKAGSSFTKITSTGSLGSALTAETKDRGKEAEEKVKELKKEEDRYHSIERRISSLQKKYDDLSKAKDRAFGGKKLALIEEEKQMLEQELLLQQQLLEEANNYYQKDRQTLANKFGASFYTNSGEVANYEEMRQREQQYLENAYRSGDDDTIEQAEKRWEAFEEAMANYEQSLDKQTEAEKRAVEIQNEIYDKHLEGLSYELEIKLMINDDELEYLEYLLSKIEDDAFKAAEKIANLSEQTEVLIEKGENYQQTIDGILNKHGVTMEQISSMSADQLLALGFTEAEIEKLRECKSGLLEVNQALLENKEAVEESLMPVYEAWGEEFDKITEKIEHASSVLEHYQNIIDLVGKKRLGMTNQDLIKLSEGQVKVAEDNLQVAQNRYQAAISSRDEAEEKLVAARKRAAADPENEELQKDVKYWEGIFNDLDADVRAQEQNRNAMLEAALEAAAEKYRLITESILEDFEKGLSAVGKDLETLSKSYERSSEIDDRYIENYEKMYELNKLSRSLEEKLSKSNSLAEQKAIRQQLEKINSYKAENVKMSEHDLEVLQKQVEVEQARIAMEEAQNAKTQVIRRRDENGNWGYVYTADTEKSNELAQEYENKIYELMKLNDEYLDDLGEKIIQAQIEMRDALAELNEEDFASREEYMAKVNEITEYYNGMINYYYDELNKSIGYNTDIYAYDLQVRTDWSAQSVGISQDQLIALSEIRREDYDSTDAYYTAIEERTGLDRAIIKQLDEAGTLSHIEEVAKQIGANNDLQLSFSDTRYAQTTEYETMEQAQEDFTSATQTMVDNLNNAYVQHTADVEHELNLVGLSLTDTESEYTAFRDHVETQISGEGGVVDQSEAAADSTDQMYKDMEEDFDFAADAVEGWQKIYSDEIDKVIKKNDDLWDNLDKLIKKLADAEEAQKDYNEGGTTGNNGGNPPSGNGNGNGQDTSTDYDTDDYDTPKPTPEPVTPQKSWHRKPWGNSYIGQTSDVMVRGNWKLTGDTLTYDNKTYKKVTGSSGTAWVVSSQISDYSEWIGNGMGGWTIKKRQAPNLGAELWNFEYYDTGGYTGQWGNEGRIAMLHQKELVLNAQDTENFLLATNVLRDIVSKIELASLSSMLNTNIISQGLTQNLGNNFEQNVVIHAEFPDATNHSEIEEAFNNLLNRASQFANRK